MKEPRYAVVVTFSFDSQVSVLLFKTWEQAMEFIKKDVVEEFNSDLNCGFDSEYTIYEDEGIAILNTRYTNDNDTTEWKIGTIFDPEE